MRQSKDRGELKKHPRSDTHEPKCQAHELQEIITPTLGDGDDLDPADFYDPEDLRP